MPEVSVERVPPYSDEAEAGTLGTILLDCNAVLGTCYEKHVTPESFYVPGNRKIYEAMLALDAAGKPSDIVTVTEYLKNAGTIDKIGGPVKLEAIMEGAITTAHAEYYIDIVQTAAKRREVITIARDAEQMAYDSSVPIEEMLSTIQTQILGASDILEGPQTNEQALLECHDTWTAASAGIMPGLPCFLSPVNEILGSFKFGKSYFVGAAPSMGKSTFLANQATFWATAPPMFAEPVPTAVYSAEMEHAEFLANIVCEMADVSRFALDHNRPEPKMREGADNRPRLEKVMDKMAVLVDPESGANRVPLYINDRVMNTDELAAWARLMVKRHGIKALLIDYAQIIEPPPRIRGTERERIAYVATALARLAKQLHIVLVTASQLSGDAADGSRPQAKDLFGSKALQQAAYGIVMIYHDESGDWVEVQKNRGGLTGPKQVTFRKPRQRFEIYWKDKNEQEDDDESEQGALFDGTAGT